MTTGTARPCEVITALDHRTKKYTKSPGFRGDTKICLDDPGHCVTCEQLIGLLLGAPSGPFQDTSSIMTDAG